MSEKVDYLLLKHLRPIRGDLGSIKDEVREIKHRLNGLGRSVASPRQKLQQTLKTTPFPSTSLIAAFLLLAMASTSGFATAGPPSIAELISVCDRAIAQGNNGKDAAACEWYAFPCACKFRDPEDPRWCTPEHESIDASVRRVIAELRRHPNPQASTERAVPEILSKIYPCR